MQKFVLDFEKPIIKLEEQIKEMQDYARSEGISLDEEIDRLKLKTRKMQNEIFAKLSREQRVKLARHPQRPFTRDYIERIVEDFVELHGDRAFGDDPAIIAGIGKLGGEKVMIMGHQKGRDTKQKLYRNFGMAHPEGYRKALRVMKLAEKFKRPIVMLIDTPGAYPGIGAEERGQAEAIARNLFEMAVLPVPIIIVIIGEGASGGALGIGVGDQILMMENTWYSVISPEGCSSILHKDASKAGEAAESLKLTAPDLLDQKIIDKVVEEPAGGAHRNHDEAAQILKQEILDCLAEFKKVPADELVQKRIEKYENMGYYSNHPFHES